MDLINLCGYRYEDLTAEWSNETLNSLQRIGQNFDKPYEYMFPALCCLGLLANIILVVVLLQSSLRTPINCLMVSIAVYDGILMAMLFVYSVFNFGQFCSASYGTVLFQLFYANVSVIAHSASLWLTCTMGIVRLCIIRQTSTAGQWSKVSRSLLAGLVTLLGVILLCLPNLLRNHIAVLPPSDNRSFDCFNRPYTIQPIGWWTCDLEKANFWVAGITLKLIPCVLLTIIMTMLISTLFEAKKRHDRLKGGQHQHQHKHRGGGGGGGNENRNSPHHERTTVILIAILLIFLLMELPQGIIVLLMGLIPSYSIAYNTLGDILDFLSLVNSSANFWLYCAMSQQFRDEAMEILGISLLKKKLGGYCSCETSSAAGRDGRDCGGGGGSLNSSNSRNKMINLVSSFNNTTITTNNNHTYNGATTASSNGDTESNNNNHQDYDNIVAAPPSVHSPMLP